MKKYMCPVCGYNQLDEPPTDYNICECCGTEFGIDDVYQTYAALRKCWVAHGCNWWSTAFPPPQNWNGYQQLVNIGYIQPELISSVSESKLRKAVVIGSPLAVEVNRRDIRITFGRLGIKQSIPTTPAPQIIAKTVRT